VATRIAQQTMTQRGVDYTDEVRRLLDAAMEVMRRGGTTSRARVADIVSAAGLSNEVFYRHFRSKDALVGALLDDGAERLTSYLSHQMAKERTPERKCRCWVEGVLSQTGEEIAAATLAVLWNAGGVSGGLASGRHFASAPLAQLLHEPLVSMGREKPELEAHLWQGTRPSRAEVAQIVAFCVAPRSGRDPSGRV
jgi:AcrR family transcriptional regulator